MAVWAKDLIPNIGNCRLRNEQGRHSLKGPGRGMKSISRGSTYHTTVGCIQPPFQGLFIPLYDGEAKDHL